LQIVILVQYRFTALDLYKEYLTVAKFKTPVLLLIKYYWSADIEHSASVKSGRFQKR